MSFAAPATLAIGPYRYRLRWTEGRLYLNGERVCSICDHDQREIWLDRTQPGSVIAEVLGHAVQRIFITRLLPEAGRTHASATELAGLG